MPELVRCKPCGYVMRRDKLRRVCPACGAKISVFEPYEDRVSARRRFLLDLDLHPILVHGPQSFATMLPGLALLAILFPAFYTDELRVVIGFTALILPVSVVGAILSGFVDAKLKFKKLSPPLVVRKIIFGLCLLIISAAGAVAVWLHGFRSDTRYVVFALAAAGFVCAVLLGHSGKQLIRPILPGR